MADFADFQQVDEGGDLSFNVKPDEDPFAGAMGGVQMNAQSAAGDLGAFAAPVAMP